MSDKPNAKQCPICGQYPFRVVWDPLPTNNATTDSVQPIPYPPEPDWFPAVMEADPVPEILPFNDLHRHLGIPAIRPEGQHAEGEQQTTVQAKD